MSEPIIVEQKEYEKPDEGWHKAKLIEVKDLGIVPTSFGERRKIQFKYEVAQVGSNGERLTTIERFNASLAARSNLGMRIRDLTGQFPTKQFDVASVEGWKGEIEIEHNESETTGKTYANIRKIRRPKEAAVVGKSGLAKVTNDDVPWIAPDEEEAAILRKRRFEGLVTPDDVPF
jgi:hypothetical protein